MIEMRPQRARFEIPNILASRSIPSMQRTSQNSGIPGYKCLGIAIGAGGLACSFGALRYAGF